MGWMQSEFWVQNESNFQYLKNRWASSASLLKQNLHHQLVGGALLFWLLQNLNGDKVYPSQMKEKIGITWESIICNAPCHGVSSLAQHMATELPLCCPTVGCNSCSPRDSSGRQWIWECTCSACWNAGLSLCSEFRAPWHCREILIIPGESLFSPRDVTSVVTPWDCNKKGNVVMELLGRNEREVINCNFYNVHCQLKNGTILGSNIKDRESAGRFMLQQYSRSFYGIIFSNTWN